MTVVAGFTGAGGAILCADKQETVSGYAKREVEKVHVWNRRKDYEYNFGIAAATDSGPYADSLTHEIAAAIGTIHEWDRPAIVDAVEKRLTEFYSKHIWPRSSQAPQIETVIAIQHIRGGHADLFHTSETAINYVPSGQICIGIGSHLANYILERSLAAGASMSHMLAVAAYMLKEVRENVEGCGKDATIWWFDRAGNCDLFWDLTERQKFLEDQAQNINVALAHVMGYMTTAEDAFQEIAGSPESLMEMLNEIKAKNIEAYEREIEQKRRTDEYMKEMDSRVRKQATADDDIPF